MFLTILVPERFYQRVKRKLALHPGLITVVWPSRRYYFEVVGPERFLLETVRFLWTIPKLADKTIFTVATDSDVPQMSLVKR
jgi:hypothetical protein